MDRIFKKNIKKRINTWKRAVSGSNEIQKLAMSVESDNYISITRYGAADVIFRIVKTCINRQQFRGFKMIEVKCQRQTT